MQKQEQDEQLKQRYAGFWIRSLAAVIDIAILFCIWLMPRIILFGDAWPVHFRSTPSDDWSNGWLWWDASLIMAAPFIAVVWFWLRFGATPGKMVLRLKVVDADTGEKLRPGQVIIRCVGYVISFLVTGIGVLSILFAKRKQGWHDQMADTVVVKSNSGLMTNFRGKTKDAPTSKPLVQR